MKKVFLLIVTFFYVNMIDAQEIRPRLSLREAAELQKAISVSGDPHLKLLNYLKLADYNIRKDGQNKADLDSAATFLREAGKINARLKIAKETAFATLLAAALAKENNQAEPGAKLAKQAVELLKVNDEDKHLGDAYMELSFYYKYYLPKELPQKIRLVESAVAAYQQEGRLLPLASAQQFLADLYANQDDQVKALKNIQLSLANYKLANYKELQGVYIIFSSIYTTRNDYQKALKYGLDALKAAEAVKDTSMQLCEINNIVGVLFTKFNDYQKANFYYKNAIEIAKVHHDNVSVLLILRNIVRTYNSLGQPQAGLQYLTNVDHQYLHTENPAFAATLSGCYATVYRALKRYDLAKPYVEQIIQVVKSNKDGIADLNNNYETIISFYTDTHQFKLARTFMKEFEEHSLQSGSETNFKQAGVARLWFRLDSASGNFRAAVDHLLAYNMYRNKIFTEANNRQLKQLNLEFETEKKENEIRVKDQNIRILNQKNELQQTKVEKADLGRNLAILCALVFLIIIGSYYNLLRHRKKASSEIAAKNKQLRHLLTEKEWLLKEVHHRVKNNLHTVICLLESQAAYLENDALKAIESSQHRIYAMSLIHQKLYQSEDIKTIDMATYIPEFIHYLNDSFDLEKTVRFHLNIEPLQLGVSLAIPLALIINEAVTNSIKYAFNGDSIGIITISMHRDVHEIMLEIADNGVGIDPVIASEHPESLGLKLMNGLSEDINATIRVENLKGTRITVRFNKDTFDESGALSANIEAKQYQL